MLEDAGPGTLDEEALFHAFNQMMAAGHYLLVTSRSFPSAWMVQLKDLQSRLRLAHLVELSEPDDEQARYFVGRDDKDYGPYGVATLAKMIRSGRVRSQIACSTDWPCSKTP